MAFYGLYVRTWLARNVLRSTISKPFGSSADNPIGLDSEGMTQRLTLRSSSLETKNSLRYSEECYTRLLASADDTAIMPPRSSGAIHYHDQRTHRSKMQNPSAYVWSVFDRLFTHESFLRRCFAVAGLSAMALPSRLPRRSQHSLLSELRSEGTPMLMNKSLLYGPSANYTRAVAFPKERIHVDCHRTLSRKLL